MILWSATKQDVMDPEFTLTSEAPPWDKHWLISSVLVDLRPTGIVSLCHVYRNSHNDAHLMAQTSSFPDQAYGTESLAANERLLFVFSRLQTPVTAIATIFGDQKDGRLI